MTLKDEMMAWLTDSSSPSWISHTDYRFNPQQAIWKLITLHGSFITVGGRGNSLKSYGKLLNVKAVPSQMC